MFELILVLTGLVVVAAMSVGYWRTRDALTPMVVFGPMVLFMYVYRPLILFYSGQLQRFIREPEALDHVALINLLGIVLFSIGLVGGLGQTRRSSRTGRVLAILDGRARGRLFGLACILGLMAVSGFVYMVYLGGGPLKVFSQSKAFLQAPSGYIGEMPMLAYAAIALLSIALRRKSIGLRHIALALFFASPHLIMGSFGGRRGPAFLIMCTLVVSWYVAKDRKPSVPVILGMVSILGAMMLFLVSNRQNVYLGSEKSIDKEAFSRQFTGSSTDSGQEFIYSAGLILTAENTDRFYWGKRYFALLFVRPVPKQLWPSKYEDLDLGWMVTLPGTAGFSELDWRRAVGFSPLLGSAGGFIADLFVEFWWFGTIACYFIGRVYAYCWKRSLISGQLWTVIYMELLALSVYLPTQSVGAWLQRALLLIVPTWLLWIKVILPRETRSRLQGYSPFPSETVRP